MDPPHKATTPPLPFPSLQWRIQSRIRSRLHHPNPRTTVATTTTHPQIPRHSLPLPPFPPSFSPPSKPSTKTRTSFSPFPSCLKIPSQISSISLLQQTPTTNPPNPSGKISTSITLTPLQSPFLTIPYLSYDPSSDPSAAVGRRTSLLWFRADLCVHDHEPFHSTSNSSLSLLPVFLFDPRNFSHSPFGFDKTGPYRAQFPIYSVFNLCHSFCARGSNLVVRIRRLETVLVELTPCTPTSRSRGRR